MIRTISSDLKAFGPHTQPSAPLAALAVLTCALASACLTVPRAPAVSGLPPDDYAAPFSAVWVGHATVLMRFGRTTVMADPNLGNNILLMPRSVPASLKPSEVPPVDVVLLSHLHMDHFDAPTLHALGPRPTVILPGNGASYLDEIDQPDKRVLPDWQTVEVAGLRITAVPARHTGGRYGFDFIYNHAYCGYVIEGAGHRVWFAGDTGYDPVMFKEIGRRFPGLEVAFIPIAPSRKDTLGAKDGWGHVGPNLALQIFEDVGARAMVPIHFEAFYASGSSLDVPRKLLMDAARKRGDLERVIAWHPGESILLDDDGVRSMDAALVSDVRAGKRHVRDAKVAVSFAAPGNSSLASSAHSGAAPARQRALAQ
ncbi:MAG: MBL fold metallo-hydrolase [Deltaproteobacteria bacterium]|nr:MBL fold metallo-hydrolase [Deltaproteobacteria bacterium]